jgi:hypothetical protein
VRPLLSKLIVERSFDTHSLCLRAFLITLMISGCTARGYSGPTRPPEELSTVTIHHVGEVTTSNVSFNGTTTNAFADNVELLPGEHSFEIHYRAEEPYPGCSGSKKSYCQTIVVTGICSGKVKTRAGRKYLLTVRNRNNLIGLTIYAKGYYDFSERSDEPAPGYGSCQELYRSSPLWF